MSGEPPDMDNEWVRNMRSMLRKEVVVTLEREPLVEVRGVLHWFDDLGEVCLNGEDGFRWAWPNLETRLADER